MALITNFATLQQATADFLNRPDLTAFLPNFLQSCESTIYKTLRIRAMENALSVTIASGIAAVPTTPVYVELKHAYVNADPVNTLIRVTPEEIYRLSPTRSGGNRPRYIATEGDNFIFSPYPGTYTIKGIYYGRLAALSASNTTNWFTTYAPDLLLYGSLLEAESFIANDPRLPTWRAFYARAYKAVEQEELRQQRSGSKLATRVS